jgi:hypothetical protein
VTPEEGILLLIFPMQGLEVIILNIESKLLKTLPNRREAATKKLDLLCAHLYVRIF